MKKQVTWIWILLCILLFAACEKPVLENYDGGKKTGKGKDKLTRVVRIRPTELRVETIDEPLETKGQLLSRGVTDNEKGKKRLYAVNVYEKKPNDEGYSMYAYGLFTNPSKIAVKMNVENLYKVECLIVEEGADKLYSSNEGYSAPLTHGAKKATKAQNSFVFSKEENFNEIKKGETKIADARTILYPRLVKLYGNFEGFSPKATKELTVDMKRTVFGLRFKVTPPDEGKLVIDYVGWRIALDSTSPAYDDMATYSFYNIEKACQDDYQSTVEVKIVWTKADGTVEQESKQLTLKRNVMTVVDIKVEGPKARNIMFKEEAAEMTTENVDWRLTL